MPPALAASMPSKRVCSTPTCPTLVDSAAYRGMCDDCKRARDKARGGREARGYGAEHGAERDRLANIIRAGLTLRCVTCGKPVGLDFHLGHNDERTAWIGAQCPGCNTSQAGKASHPKP